MKIFEEPYAIVNSFFTIYLLFNIENCCSFRLEISCRFRVTIFSSQIRFRFLPNVPVPYNPNDLNAKIAFKKPQIKYQIFIFFFFTATKTTSRSTVCRLVHSAHVHTVLVVGDTWRSRPWYIYSTQHPSPGSHPDVFAGPSGPVRLLFRLADGRRLLVLIVDCSRRAVHDALSESGWHRMADHARHS